MSDLDSELGQRLEDLRQQGPCSGSFVGSKARSSPA